MYIKPVGTLELHVMKSICFRSTTPNNKNAFPLMIRTPPSHKTTSNGIAVKAVCFFAHWCFTLFQVIRVHVNCTSIQDCTMHVHAVCKFAYLQTE